LCHASGDKTQVRDLYQRLTNDGFCPWLDEENLLPGQDWSQEISRAVRSSVVVLVCLSRSSIAKTGYVQKEIKYALDVADEQPEGSIFLIPVKLEDCEVPERLRRWQWVDLFEERAYERLLKALRTRLPEQLASPKKLGESRRDSTPPASTQEKVTQWQFPIIPADVTFREDGRTKHYDSIRFGTDTAGNFWLYPKCPRDTADVDLLEHIPVVNIKSIETPPGAEKPKPPFATTVTLKNNEILKGWAYHWTIHVYQRSLPAPMNIDLDKVARIVFDQ
jgi:TIR domain